MNVCLFAFCAGAIILYSFATLLPWWIYIVALLAFFFCVSKRFLLPGLFFLLGSAYANEVATHHQSNILPASFEGVWVSAVGFRCSLIATNEWSQSFRLCASEIKNDAGDSLSGPRLLQVSAPLSLELPSATELFSSRLKLKRPRGMVNPVGQPLEQYYFQQKIVATGRAADITVINPVKGLSAFPWRSYVLDWREQILTQLQKTLGSLESKGVITALVVGDRSAISGAWQKALAATGTQHLMAISGLHVGMIALLLWRFLPKGRVGLMFFACFTLLYVVLVGFSASAQRAWLMSLVLAFAGAGYLKLNWLTAWLCALTLVLILDPLSVLSLGFVYSFASVALLVLLAHSGWVSLEQPVRSFLLVQFFFLLLLGALNALVGVEHNGVFMLANLVAVPWVSWVVLPASLFGFIVSLIDVQFAAAIFGWVNEILQFLYAFLQALAASPFQLNQWASLSRLVAFAVVFASVLLLGRLTLYSAAGMLLLVAALVMPVDKSGDEPELLVFDTGQGLSLLVRSEGAVWLYDLGPDYGRSSSVRRSILPYLNSVAIPAAIDGLVISHGDNDHAGDYAYFLSRIKPSILWSGQVDRLPNTPKNSVFSPCRRGMRWGDDRVFIEVIYPAGEPQVASSNNHSCVLRVTFSGVSFLLMGDLEGQAEKQLVSEFRDDLSADVLIAGHHGSKNASSSALLKYVQPEFVVFSTGYRNSFSHPHTSVVSRVNSFNAMVLNTADTGALRFTISDDTLQVSQFRTLRDAFWLTP